MFSKVKKPTYLLLPPLQGLLHPLFLRQKLRLALLLLQGPLPRHHFFEGEGLFLHFGFLFLSSCGGGFGDLQSKITAK